MDDQPADPAAPPPLSAVPGVDEAVCAELASTQTLLGDAGTVLAARQKLDGLLLDVLSTPGLAPAAVTRLREYIGGDALSRAHAALTRLSVAPLPTGDRQ